MEHLNYFDFFPFVSSGTVYSWYCLHLTGLGPTSKWYICVMVDCKCSYRKFSNKGAGRVGKKMSF